MLSLFSQLKGCLLNCFDWELKCHCACALMLAWQRWCNI